MINYKKLLYLNVFKMKLVKNIYYHIIKIFLILLIIILKKFKKKKIKKNKNSKNIHFKIRF